MRTSQPFEPSAQFVLEIRPPRRLPDDEDRVDLLAHQPVSYRALAFDRVRDREVSAVDHDRQSPTLPVHGRLLEEEEQRGDGPTVHFVEAVGCQPSVVAQHHEVRPHVTVRRRLGVGCRSVRALPRRRGATAAVRPPRPMRPGRGLPSRRTATTRTRRLPIRVPTNCAPRRRPVRRRTRRSRTRGRPMASSSGNIVTTGCGSSSRMNSRYQPGCSRALT